jgi:CspA family cold shock protein
MKERGHVKRFNRCWGWIAREGELPDVFFHHSNLMTDRKHLRVGQAVEFEIGSSPKGPTAENVVVVDQEK